MIQQRVESIIGNFEKFLASNLPKTNSFHPHFNDALALMLKAGGKRFRPLLLLCVVLSENEKELANALLPALSVEFIHTYSLIHDDLPAMDNADFRRSTPTIHKTYDDVTAILVGDALNTEAFYALSNSNLPAEIVVELTKVLSRASGIGGMVLGQAIDCFFEKKKLSLDELKFLHKNKTGELIKASLKMGAIISNLDENYTAKIENFGENLGLLFQIQDDIIDATQSSQNAGKPTQNDEFKNSFVNLLGLKEAKAAKQELLDICRLSLDEFSPKLGQILNFLIQNYLK